MQITNASDKFHPLAGSQGCAVKCQLHCGTVLLLVVLWVITNTMQVKTARRMMEGIHM
jgi:hypothetical protein